MHASWMPRWTDRGLDMGMEAKTGMEIEVEIKMDETEVEMEMMERETAYWLFLQRTLTDAEPRAVATGTSNPLPPGGV